MAEYRSKERKRWNSEWDSKYFLCELAAYGMMVDLHFSLSTRRLVRSFDFSNPMKKFHETSHWRVFTIILLEMTMVREFDFNQGTLPSDVSLVGISLPEYKYLVCSSVTSLI